MRVKLVGDILEIRGGGSFKRRVHVPGCVGLQSKSYINGVLYAKLLKLEESASEAPSKRFDL